MSDLILKCEQLLRWLLTLSPDEAKANKSIIDEACQSVLSDIGAQDWRDRTGQTETDDGSVDEN